jgi:hypothetical protein
MTWKNILGAAMMAAALAASVSAQIQRVDMRVEGMT